MNRSEMLRQMKEFPGSFDIIIIGGGATGLGAAVDACSRGYKTLLLEQHDFAKGTSSRSTKLIHGGLRYLKQGNIALVLEALRERGILCKIAPHLVSHRAFLVPSYHWWDGPLHGIGVKVYDILAGKLGLEPSKHLSRKETLEALPTLEPSELRGGTIYYDGQFDDARLAITLARTCADLGGTLLNYMPVTSFIKKNDMITGVHTRDLETGMEYKIPAGVVINATGPFSDTLRTIDNPKSSPIISPSQGIHLVLPRKYLPGDTAILVPHTKDGRVLFIVPWHDKLLVGTTDTPVKKAVLEPTALKREIDFILEHASQYLTCHPKHSDILSVFAGLRPLVKEDGEENTSSLSRDHTILVSDSGLITICGGKWTTYRKMGLDVINEAASIGSLPKSESKTEALKLHGYASDLDPDDPWSVYGSDQKQLELLLQESTIFEEPLSPEFPYLKGEVIWATRYEMARTIEDVLARRTRALLLNAKESVKIAPIVASLMANELDHNAAWITDQLGSYKALAKHYISN